MTDKNITTYRAQPGDTFTSIAEALGDDPVRLYLQNWDAVVIPNSANPSEGPPVTRDVTIAFEARSDEHLDRLAQGLGLSHSFLLFALDQQGIRLEEKQSDSWHWYEFSRGLSVYFTIPVEIPRAKIVEGTEIYMSWAERPIREKPPATSAASYTVLTPETFADVALRRNVYEDELRRLNPDVRLLPRSTNPFLKEYRSEQGTSLALIAKNLGVKTNELFQIFPDMQARFFEGIEEAILTAPYIFRQQNLAPEMSHIPPNTTLTLPRERTIVVQGLTTFADVAQRQGVDVLALYLMNASAKLERRSTAPALPFTAKADTRLSAIAKTTIAFDAKKGEWPEEVAERIGIDSSFIWDIINTSPDLDDAIEIKSDFAFSWAEFKRNISFSREIEVMIPPHFIAEGTVLMLSRQEKVAETGKGSTGFSSVEVEAEVKATDGGEKVPSEDAASLDTSANAGDTTTSGISTTSTTPVGVPGTNPLTK